jgi:mono/diheme cytochrome c family protein
MRFTTVVSAVFATALALRPVVVSAQPSPVNQDIGAAVRAVFAAKCAACHGFDLMKPKGRFGYVLDLARVAKNPEMVIPHQPGESELWILVERDEMPPPDSPRGPLTSEQKQTIREWIASGAPDTRPGPTDSPTAVRPEGPASPAVERFLCLAASTMRVIRSRVTFCRKTISFE